MQLLAGLETCMDGRPLAWALEYPGCYAFGSDNTAAVENLAGAFRSYCQWIKQRCAHSWLAEDAQIQVQLCEVFEGYQINEAYERIPSGGYEVNGWFQHDWKPLLPEEIEHGLQLLAFTRTDLQALIADIHPDRLDLTYPGERWSIRGILGHIGTAEWWYLDRLNLAISTRPELPKDVFERLSFVRSRLVQFLPELAGVNRVTGIDGEFWSPRKLLRRAVWHERDHIEHIQKLAGQS